MNNNREHSTHNMGYLETLDEGEKGGLTFDNSCQKGLVVDI